MTEDTMQSTSESGVISSLEYQTRSPLPDPPVVHHRVGKDGKPADGNPSMFEHSFSCTDGSGIKYDFRDGLRIYVPAAMPEGRYFVEALDGNDYCHFRVVLNRGDSVTSNVKWFVDWTFRVRRDDELIMEHRLDLKDRRVAIAIPKGGLGDEIAWFSSCERFMKNHGCRLTVCVEDRIKELFEHQYTDMFFAPVDDWKERPYYAVYHMGVFTPDNMHRLQPDDFRYIGLHDNASAILGVDFDDTPPRVDLSNRAVKDRPYVCIAARASSRCKEWLNPCGWICLVDWLRSKGYDVYCIDREAIRGDDTVPFGTIPVNGSLPLQERVNLIAGSKGFIGLSSGLSWLAWCCHVPVTIISGWTLPHTEFHTPYRVINRCVCHGCWNDQREMFDSGDADYCPRFRDTAREHECSKSISAEMVIRTVAEMLGETYERKD